MTQFLPEVQSLVMDEQLRSLTSKLPDMSMESAEDVPTSIHKAIMDSECAAYIMVYFSSHGNIQFICLW